MKRAMLLALGLLAGMTAAAQDWPAKPVHFIVPYPPGRHRRHRANRADPPGGAARTADRHREPRRRRRCARHRGGGEVRPDGYTFLFTLSSHTINPLLYKLNYDVEHDFSPVTLIVSVPQLIAAYPGSPLQNMQRCRRGRQGKAGQRPVRVRRQRHALAHRRRAAEAESRHRPDPCAV